MLSGGNVNDCTRFEQVMNAVRVERIGPGRPRTRPSWTPRRPPTDHQPTVTIAALLQWL